MRLRRFLPVLILTSVLFLASCSSLRYRSLEIREEGKVLAAETESLRQELSSIRKEIRILESISLRKTERVDTAAAETVTEQFDTLGRLISRTTERREDRSVTRQEEATEALSYAQEDSLAAERTEVDAERLESDEMKISEEYREDGPVGMKRSPWGKRILICCGCIAILWIALRLFKSNLKRVLTKIKRYLK